MKAISLKRRVATRIGAATLAMMLTAGLVGCGGQTTLEAGVAASVNGQQIMEQTITDYIADFRAASGLESDEAWGQWMADNGYTPETVRQQVIDHYIDEDLYAQAAEEYGVTVSQEDVDAALEETKAMFESEEAFQEALTSAGTTEEEYVEESLRPGVLQNKLAEAVAAQDSGDGADDEAALLEAAQSMSAQFDGAKRTSHILLAAEEGEDDATLAARAQELLDQINASEITFEDAAKQYSADSASAASGGDAGWDALAATSAEYRDAVKDLAKGETVAAPVKTDDGYEIITVTDVYNLPEEGVTSLDDLPAEFVAALRTIKQSTGAQQFAAWFQEYRANANIVESPMPEGLPYAIDMAPYEKAADDAAASSGASGEGAAAGAEGATGSAADGAAAEGAAQPSEQPSAS